MTEINLLRWHLPRDSLAQKIRMRIWIIILITVFLMFSIAHLLLSNACFKLNRDSQDLKNKINIYQNNQANDLNRPGDLSMSEIIQIQSSQKQLWQVMNLLHCLEKNHIQITTMNLTNKQINLLGLVESPITLSKALAFCLEDQNNLSVKKWVFSHKNRIGLLQFILVF